MSLPGNVPGSERERDQVKKIYVGNLPWGASEADLRDFFSTVGEVHSVAVITDRETGRSRGFGFVEMSTTEEADQAISQFNGKDLDGRQLRVEKASSGGTRSPGGGSSRGFGGSSRPGRW